jgi:hypothetical protein
MAEINTIANNISTPTTYHNTTNNINSNTNSNRNITHPPKRQPTYPKTKTVIQKAQTPPISRLACPLMMTLIEQAQLILEMAFSN